MKQILKKKNTAGFVVAYQPVVFLGGCDCSVCGFVDVSVVEPSVLSRRTWMALCLCCSQSRLKDKLHSDDLFFDNVTRLSK